MLKGRLWRFLICLFVLYLIFVLFFLRSFNSSKNTTKLAVPEPEARVIVNDDQQQDVSQKKIVVRQDEAVVNTPSNLEPFMSKGVLGNYEPKNLVKNSGPGEDGEGVQLQGDDIKRGDESVAEYGFNEVASEKISLDRRARDTR